MNTVEQTVSTWGADIVRGLAHPDSVAARQSRTIEATYQQLMRVEEFYKALKLIRSSLRTEEQLCDLLHCAGTTLAAANSGTLEKQDAALVDMLADAIQYRTCVEAEALIDCVKGGITTGEVEL